MYNFNVRVYGLLINDQNQILLSDEEEYGFRFCKFPGGGLEYGEGLIDALKREFMEECHVDVDIIAHFYTTDFYIQSVFNDSQVISVYYIVRPNSVLQLDFRDVPFDFDSEGDLLQAFRWKNLNEIGIQDVTFPTDQRVVELLKEKWPKNL
ncbi:MAG: NUDIX hydrolase [Daejeonella sp.]|uniref:NUDIX domain-containing protein n=1 Tax=Daejeonella sp. TaxID=2805397 RepID=UPI0027357AB2|nr:NUDIX hydrolase [Daejeonella sp.]MDP3466738.1 NUDIX hydrolase [Daejeonella sp.]